MSSRSSLVRKATLVVLAIFLGIIFAFAYAFGRD
jgi:hypothetical protein